MDPVDELLRGVRSTNTGRKHLTGTMRFTGELTLLASLQGEVHLEDNHLNTHDLAIVSGPFEAKSTGAEVLVGTYHAPQGLTKLLPPILIHHECEAPSYEPGSELVQNRLVEWLLVCTLRAWFDQQKVPPGWDDATVGPVLKAMHAAPAEPWTLAKLAGEAGVSRTTLANRFVKVMGKPPLTYLTDWRMSLAADLLAGSTATVGSVARKVGYADAFGFSAAFKRVYGVSPTECRKSC
ncbi:AraC family transcriptional regulator [Kibdelosporangium philippinense]|uniref:AraC family transcriptional regulator n=1 Tax=Kibdelosporangium philippinense TaxID=211113 RepID=A0ABS8ZDT6_9PSEU|nr:AraC family transcriptional regulator [Kibdelosporangium philippinense]MCE7006008.1 AraC family transcriptional regulator [Kibdelosporangium philippinense]